MGQVEGSGKPQMVCYASPAIILRRGKEAQNLYRGTGAGEWGGGGKGSNL